MDYLFLCQYQVPQKFDSGKKVVQHSRIVHTCRHPSQNQPCSTVPVHLDVATALSFHWAENWKKKKRCLAFFKMKSHLARDITWNSSNQAPLNWFWNYNKREENELKATENGVYTRGTINDFKNRCPGCLGITSHHNKSWSSFLLPGSLPTSPPTHMHKHNPTHMHKHNA
jgi:hypothetical protein